MTAPRTRIWQGIEAEDPPYFRHDYAELLAMAEKLHQSRVKRLPAMVAAGRLSADEAARQIEVFAHVVQDWRWIVTGEGEAAPFASYYDRRDALDESLRTVAGIARQQHGFSDDLERQAHLLIALRWHLDPERTTHAFARVTHQLRAQVATGDSAPKSAEEARARSTTKEAA